MLRMEKTFQMSPKHQMVYFSGVRVSQIHLGYKKINKIKMFVFITFEGRSTSNRADRLPDSISGMNADKMWAALRG